MKAVLVLAVLSSIVALTMGETCQSKTDCTHVKCPEADYSLDCHTGDCTCTHTTASCQSMADCDGATTTIRGDQPCTRNFHCVDNKCRCGFGTGDFGPRPGNHGNHNGN